MPGAIHSLSHMPSLPHTYLRPREIYLHFFMVRKEKRHFFGTLLILVPSNSPASELHASMLRTSTDQICGIRYEYFTTGGHSTFLHFKFKFGFLKVEQHWRLPMRSHKGLYVDMQLE
jgi:hypothetical protein